jgi:hypothetical protein
MRTIVDLVTHQRFRRLCVEAATYANVRHSNVVLGQVLLVPVEVIAIENLE